MVLLATLAAVIASQAVITGAFSVARQAMQLGYIPRMDIKHTSRDTIGQIYIPWVNRSEEHTSELQSLMRTSYAVFCLKKKTIEHNITTRPKIRTNLS